MTDENAEKNAIREVLATYCFRLDAGDMDAMAALFVPDGVWETDFGKGTGRAGIAEHGRSLRAHGPEKRPRAVHLCTNIVVTLHGDTANVLSNWTTVQNSETGPKISTGDKSGGVGHDPFGDVARGLGLPDELKRFGKGGVSVGFVLSREAIDDLL